MHEEWMKNALEAWEPRVTEVRVTAGKNTDETSDSKVTMLVQYQVRSTGTEDYSLIPVEEG
jgi:phage baseplate assembly protein W